MDSQGTGNDVAASRRDVVFVFSLDTLADCFAREFCRTTDQALLAISRADDRIDRIIAANPWRSAPVAAMRSLISQRGEDDEVDRVALVRPLRLRRRDPTSIPALLRSYRRYDSVLARSVRDLGLDAPAVLTFNPFVAAFCPLRWASSVTYYAQDDWAAYSPVTPWWPAYRRAYSVLRDRRTRIISVSDELAARVAAAGPAVVIPNGINPVEWYQTLPAPRVISELTPPIVTYAGVIDERLDIDLIAGVAADCSVGSVALIGPCDSAALRDKLCSIPKVTLCGLMARKELRGALMHSSVCIIPHVISPLTTAMSPLKLYEYLAAGKPVVTTQLEPVRGVSKRVSSALGDDFPAAVRAALRLPGQPENERLEFLRYNSWAARHERMLRVMLADDADWWDS